MDVNKDRLMGYASDIRSGKIASCRLIGLAVDRFYRMMEDDRYWFDWGELDRFVKFVGVLKHFTGQWNNQRFVLEPWQLFVIGNVLCFKKGGSDLRVFRMLYMQVARKNAKTSLIAALSLYMLFLDREPNAEIVVLANSLDQVATNLGITQSYARQLDPSGKVIKMRHRSIKAVGKGLNNELKVRAADHKKLDGLNPSVAIIDEFHQGELSTLEVMESGQGARRNPLIAIITTAGTDTGKYCYELRNVCAALLRGEVERESLAAFVYELDDEDWKNEEGVIEEVRYMDDSKWIKANPNIGVSVSVEYLKDQIAKTVSEPDRRVGVLIKNLNCWVDVASGDALDYVPSGIVRKCMTEMDWEMFRGMECFSGIDLASVSDLNAVSFMFCKEDQYWFKTVYFLPEVTHNTYGVQEHIRVWSAVGLIEITKGAVQDQNAVLELFRMLRDEYGIEFCNIAVDKYNANQLLISLFNDGFMYKEFNQSIFNFNIPTKELQRCMYQDVVRIDKSPVTLWCFSNCELKVGNNDNVKCFKKSGNYANKIDGVISMQMAFGGYLSSVYAMDE